MSEPLSYEERRRLMLEALGIMGTENSSITELCNLITYASATIENGPRFKSQAPDAFRVNGEINSWLVYYFLGAITVGEGNNKRPSFPNVVKFPDTMRNHVFMNSDQRICTKWSTFLNNLVQWGLLRADYPVERTAEYIGNHWPALDGSEFTFEIRNDVKAVYDRAKLGSCMYGEPYTSWYDANPDKVSVVVISRGSEYVGRALLWQTELYDENTQRWEAQPFLDRVYPSDGGRHVAAIKAWAEKQGILPKTYNDMSDEGADLRVIMSIPEDGYPYMDSLKYADADGNAVTLYTSDERDYDARLDSTEGDGPGWNDDRCTCERCESRVDEDDTHSVYSNEYHYDVWCSSCVEHAAAYCEGIQEYVRDSSIITLHNGDPAAEWEDIASCEVDGEYYYLEDMTTIEASNNVWGRALRVSDDYVATLVNGDAFIKDQADDMGIVWYDGAWRYMADMLHEVDLDGEDEVLIAQAMSFMENGGTFEQWLEAKREEEEKDVA